MKQYLNFTERVVLVTGSTRGIGYVIAEAFAEQGAKIIINGRVKNTVQKVVDIFEGKGYAVIGISADIGDAGAVEEIVSQIKNRFGHLDILINNAALRQWNSLENISDEIWEDALRTNFFGVFHLIKKMTPLLKQRLNPSIINISSIAALRPLFSQTGIHYIVSKGALLSLTLGLAKELGEDGIRINAVIPGFVNKENDENFSKKYSSIADQTFLKKLPTSVDIANACLFLASDLATAVSGESIIVGGY
ncbi:MAG: SDR family oxidoreductase [Parcubacteria group bacterium]|nr:SDR family oxidoreductase [Parcubacteria group bacterium]